MIQDKVKICAHLTIPGSSIPCLLLSFGLCLYLLRLAKKGPSSVKCERPNVTVSRKFAIVLF
jgi:hypothetical protein